MWANLHMVAASQARACPTDAEDAPSQEYTIRRRRSIDCLILSTNPCHRHQQRTTEKRRCCQCTRFMTCGTNPCIICKCRSVQRECYNCCADRNCQNRPSELIVSTPPPGDNSICRPVATTAPNHPSVRRDARPTGSLAEPPIPAQADPTIALPVAEEVPNASSIAAPNDPSTTNGEADTPGTGISAFPDLSQEAVHGESRETVEEEVEIVEQVPEGGGTAMTNVIVAPAVEWAGLQELNLEDPEKMLDLATQQSTECDDKLMSVYGDTTHRND